MSRFRAALDVIGGLAAVGTVIGVGVATYQIIDINNNNRQQRALEENRHILGSEAMVNAKRAIEVALKNGDPSSDVWDFRVATVNKVAYDIKTYMNNLEATAGDVNRKVISGYAVCKELAQTYFLFATPLLYGAPGTLTEGIHWDVDRARFPSNDEYPEIRALYSRWFPNHQYFQGDAEKPCRMAEPD